MKRERFDPTPVLAGLKDFQRRTVERVFGRMYRDDPPGRRFLVADEVGLGKTMVARGIVARVLEHLHDKVDRIDIVYVCSNAAIAAQNVNRLNVLGEQEFSIATRLTMLPTQVHDLSSRKINFVSFTPGTTFDLKSRSGQVRERAILCRLLVEEELFHPRGLSNLLRNGVRRARWQSLLASDDELDPEIHKQFVRQVRRDRRLRLELGRLSDHFSDGRRRVTHEIQQQRLAIIGGLRHLLASVCVDALEPDLVILDEFQRFRNLLDGDSEAAELARTLFDYEDVRVLLLSATPYKMLSFDHEKDDDHYPDFLRTLGFLLGSDEAVDEVKEGIARYRRALYASLEEPESHRILRARRALERHLRRVMCRTERVAMTHSLDSMLVESPRPAALNSSDLRQARLADRVSRALRAPDVIEYWKSSPYLLSYMRNYKLRERLDDVAESPSKEVLDAFAEAGDAVLTRKRLDAYEAIYPANPRLRSLFADTIDHGMWRMLWMPPSMPYSEPGGVYRDAADATKSLVFSSWSLVPDAIATICSYEAERRMLAKLGADLQRDALYDQLRPLLRFTRESDGRLTGMPALVRLYPSPSLASLVDPLRLALGNEGEGPMPAEMMLACAEEQLRPHIERLTRGHSMPGREDERWYWAGPALLDAEAWPGVVEWALSSDGWGGALHEDEAGARFRDHVEHLIEAMQGALDPPLGVPPTDLVRAIAELALAGPGVCVLRALRRVAPSLPPDDSALLTAASRGAAGFRTLFNVPESIGLLRGEDPHTPYWRLALRHGIDGNLQALLDEHVHVLQESLGLIDAEPDRRVATTADAMAGALSIRTAQIRIDEYRLEDNGGGFTRDDFNIRCRFALRFGELKDDSNETLARADVVRTAFNSPFRPFVLTSTSIGQEGLDFHTWCHAVMHWNLPSNPVDLEQREGRVHRYKGHAIRKNVARVYGLAALRRRGWSGLDPWNDMFTMAAADRDPGVSDLVPNWIYEVEGGARVERRVPMTPYTREVEHLARLKRGLALYRLVFGQPRQEDLLQYMNRVVPQEQSDELVAQWRIDLSP